MYSSGFGATGASTSSPFSRPATTGFSPPVFGQTQATNTMFGSTTNQPTSLFGASTTTPAFGQTQTTQPAFGAFTAASSNTSSIFGTQQNATTSGGLFGSNTTQAFGQPKTSFGGFGTTQPSSGLFGQPQQQTSLFGQPAAQSASGLFGASPAFGATATATGGTTFKFTPVTGTDTMVKNGASTSVSTRHHCITCMKEYENKSLEELRMEDYVAGRKGQQQGAQPAGLFGSTTQPTLFGTGASSTSTGMFGTENKSLFGTTNQGFGTTTATNMFGQTNQANSLFGKPAGTATPFGAPATTSTSNFGFNNTSSNLFGANTNQAKPFGTTAPQTGVLFGATSQPATGFGTQQTAFGTTSFGAQPAQNGGIFGQKQAFSLGGPSTGFAFNQPATTASTSLFGAKPATTGFGTGFGTNTSTSTGFGSTPFGQQNQNASPFGASNFNKPTGFPFGQTQPNTSLGMSLGGGTSLFNNTASKPGGLFGQTSTGSSLFSGGFGTTSTFNTGSSSLGLGTQPSLGLGTGLGTGLGSLGGLNTQNPISQHLNAYSAIPFGVCSLFKNLLAPTGKADELIKPTSPAAQKALISGQNYKISPKSTSKIKIRPVESNNENKKSLFDGLDEEDALNPVSRPNLKRLVVQPRLFNEVPSCNPINELSPVVKTSPRILLTPKTSLQRDNTSNNPVENARTLPNRRLHEWKPSISGISEQTSEITQNLSSTCVNDEGKDVSAAISSSSDSDHEETPPPDLEGTLTEHPARITLRRAGYYTIPSLDELAQLVAPDGSCIIDSFTVGRLNYGNVYFPDSFDVAGLNLDDIVHFRHKEVVVYPDDDQKPPVGSGLNRRAQVTLDRVWPVDKSTRAPITDVKRLADLDYESKLMKACGKHHSTFIEYRPQTGSWVFKVEHFSKYGLSDSDEEDEEIKKIKIGPQDPKLVISKAMPSTPLNAVKDVRNTLPSRAVLMGEDDEEMDDGITTPFALDEMERRHLSPTSKLATATGTSSHKLQLMKASFFDRDFNIDGEYLGLEDLEQPPIFQINGYGVDSKKLAQAYNWYKKSEFADNYSDVDQDYPPSQEAEVEQQIPPRPASVEPEVVQQYIASAKIHPKAYVLRHKGFVPYSEVLEKAVESGALTDLCLTYGRASRIGWGPRSRLVVHNTVSSATEEPAPSLFSTIQGRNKNDMSPSLIQCHKLYLDDESQVPFLDTVAQHLQIIFKQSHFNREDSECPYVTPKLSVTGLHRHNSVATNLAKGLNDPYLKNAATIWSLCTALWGNVGDWSPESHSLVMERKAAVSDWLEIVLSEEVNQEASQTTGTASVYSLLSGHKIQEACDKAHELGDYQLSLVFNQCGSGAGAQSMMRAQLNQWRDTAADTRIDHGRLKCIMLAAGLKVHAMSNGVLNSCNDLTWLRAFALHLWYFTSVSASVTDALVEYEKSFTGPVEENYASSPVPLYSNQYTIESSSKTPIYDIRYHLLKLFSTKSYKMEPILDPATFTADSLDYRLSWFLLRVLSELGYSHVGSYSACLVHTSFASQLEAHGLWYWAVFVVQHHPEHKVREKLVKDLLERHVSLDATNEDEEFVQSILGIPVRWVYEAKAIKARIHKRYKDAANFLLKAGNWDESHNLIMNHIYSAAIVYEEYDYLEGLLKELSIEDRCREVNGWSVGGEVVLQYLDVVKQVNDIVAARDPSVGFLLERLQDQLKDLCLKIQLMKVNTPLDRLSQAEMSKRTANLVQNLAIHCNDDNPQGLRVLAHLIDELPLTSDLAHSQWQEVLAWWSRSCVMEVPSE